MKVALLTGGRSLERGVSLRSGRRVADSLSGLGHEVVQLDLGPDLVARLSEARPEVAFIALHGTEGEDGTVQALLELLGIPYTGPGVAACRLSADKDLTKHVFRRAGVRTPDWVTYTEAEIRDFGAASTFGIAVERLGLPLAVKPTAQGSSLGVRVVTGAEEMPDALMTALSYGSSALVEAWVNGRELAVSVLGDEVLPVVEAVPTESATYDFEARYEVGGATFTCPARLSSEDERAVRETALAAYEAIGCSDFSRVDLMLGEDGPSVLEVNAIPGLTETSLLPQAAEAAGIGFDALIERLLEMALDSGAETGP